MKKILALLFVYTLTHSIWGQIPSVLPINKLTNRIDFTGIDSVVGTTQSVLLFRVSRWAKNIPYLQKSSLITNGKSNISINLWIAQPFTHVTANDSSKTIPLQYTVKIIIYNNYYTYEITNFVLKYENFDLSAEEQFLGGVRPLNEDGARGILNLRICFDELVTQLQHNIKHAMN